jgi:thiamine biosynthesis lipoprotein
MKETQHIMGMPITIHVIDSQISKTDVEMIFEYFKRVDRMFSTYKQDSEISQYNAGILPAYKLSPDIKEIFQKAMQTKKETNGYFDIEKNGYIDPSGIVKGWAIYNAGSLLSELGYKNFFIDAGGDIQVSGKNEQKTHWTIGIRNPFKTDEIVKVLKLDNKGVATSGTYMRGQHIYNPHNKHQEIKNIASMTVIGPNIYEADRFATAAFAMGKKGIEFIESLEGFDGYMIDEDAIATFTNGFEQYIL